jgi:hypothetical protein
MPVFDWECAKAHQFELYQHTRGEAAPTCIVELESGAQCGETTERIWGITKRTGYAQYPYVTKNLTGKPIEVRDAAHESRLMREHKVTKRDDAAYIDKTWDGYDFRTGQQKYTEGRGVGSPGCWV